MINTDNCGKEVLSIIKKMKAENCYADGDKYFKNYKEELVLIDAEKHLA